MSGRRVRLSATAYALLGPSLFGVAAFLLLPMFVVGWLSLHRWDLLGRIRYVGLDNWRSVLSDGTFGNSLVVTAVFVALVLPVQTVLGLFAASMLARRLPGSVLFRTLYVLPWTNGIAAAGNSASSHPEAVREVLELDRGGDQQELADDRGR